MINTAIISETNKLQASFLKNMNQPAPSYVVGPKKHFKFVSWIIDESLDSNLKLVNDITTLSNERSHLETFEQYKIRQQMQRLMMKYRYMFTTDISISNDN